MVNSKSNVAMLVADQLQLDRRVIHEAATLSRRGFQINILSICSTMEKPKTLEEGIAIVEAWNTGSAAAKGNWLLSLWKIKNGFSSIARKYLPRRLQEMVFFGCFNPAGSIAKVYKTLRMDAWEVIIAHDLPLLPLAFALREKQGYGKVVLDAHELYDEQLDVLKTKTARRYWRRIEDQYLPRCDGVMTVTQRIAEELQNRHNLTEKPTVLMNACPYTEGFPEKDKLHRLYGIAPDRKIVLCQGGLAPTRSLEEFIEAWQFMPVPRPALVFLGFGQPDYIAKLRSLIKRLHLEKDVFVGKAVPPDQVLDYTCGAAIGLISNRGAGINNTDGGPNRLFEYIQARVPVLSYEHNGVRNILNQTGTGWVVRWESPRQLAEILQRKLLEAENIPLERLDEAAKKFCWENEEPKLLDLIMRVKGD